MGRHPALTSLSVFAGLLAVSAVGCDPVANDSIARSGGSIDVNVHVTTVEVVNGLNTAVAFDWAPDGRIFFTEKNTGQVRVAVDGTLLDEPVIDLPVNYFGDRGLMGVAVHPNFSENHRVYVSYQESSSGEDSINRDEATVQHVAYFTVTGNKADDASLAKIFTVPVSQSAHHELGNIHFGPDGKLYVTNGDAEHLEETQRTTADARAGRIMRLNDDGSIPDDGPFGEGDPTFGYGMRNAFDFCFNPQTGKLYATENGTNHHDEVQVVLPGGNQGWPMVEGRADDMDGDPNGEVAFAAKTASYVDPLVDAVNDTVVPTGIDINPTDMYGQQRRGNIFYGEWKTGVIRRLVLDASGNAPVGEPYVFMSSFSTFSIVDLAFYSGDGKLYVLTHSALFRVDPA